MPRSKRRPSQVRHLVRQVALNTTGDVLTRGGSPTQQLTTQTQAERASDNGISVRTQGKLDFLSNLHPDLLEQVKKGELSVDGAYKQVRGTKKPSPLERVQQIWGQAGAYERMEIARWINTAHHENVRRELDGDEGNGNDFD